MAANQGICRHEKRIYEFGPFRLDTAESLLLHNGQPVPMTAKAFDILLVLVRNHGHLVAKEELMKEVWPDSIVEENNLTVNISALRKALAEGSPDRLYIETLPKRGYRFVAEVREKPYIPEEAAGRSAAETPPATSDRTFPAPESKGASASRRRRFLFLASGLLLAGTVALIYYLGLFHTSNRPLSAAGPKSIAVLPFKTMGTETQDELLGLGMADALITKLSDIRHMVIRPTGSVLKYTGPEKDVLTAGRELQVDVILDGTILKAGEQVRVTVRLVGVQDGISLWTRTFDLPWTGVFALQDSVAEGVARPLIVQLTGKEQAALRRRYTDNPTAYRCFLKGLVHWDKRTEEGLNQAIDLFKQAIEADPTYALAYAGLADSYVLLATYGILPTNDAYLQAKAAAMKALERDETLAEPNATLGLVKLYYDWDWPGAERDFRRAIELKPDYATAHQRLALGLMRIGKFDEALVEIKLARDLDPLSLIIGANVGQVLYHARRYDEAIEELQKKLKADPHFWLAHRVLGEAYLQKGMMAEAFSALNLALEYGGGPSVLAEVGFAHAVSGDKGAARDVLEKLKSLSRQRYLPPFSIALVLVGLGEKDQAFEWLQKSYEERSRWLMTLKVDPMLDSLRPDPRFEKLLLNIRLAP